MAFQRRNIPRPRRDTNESPIGTHLSFRLVSTDETPPDTVETITDFKDFKRLRKIYHSLSELPESLFDDWISCCTEHIAGDIDGKSTKDEIQQNVRISALYEHFKKKYKDALREQLDPVLRRKLINDALIELLRSLLGKPCELTNEILTHTGFPKE